MKTFRFRFTLDADLGITIEAKDLDAAKEALCRMDIEEIVGSSNINDYDVKDIDAEGVEEEHIKINVHVTEIKWDTDEEPEAPEFALPDEDEFEVEVDNYRGEVDSFDEEEAISDYLSDTYGYAVDSFDYEVLSRE